MRRPSRWTLWLLAFAGVGFAFYVAAFLLPAPQSPPINWESFERIQTGMSRAEVEKILGNQPGDYTTGDIENIGLKSNDNGLPSRWASRWLGDRGLIAVAFDRNGKVWD